MPRKKGSQNKDKIIKNKIPSEPPVTPSTRIKMRGPTGTRGPTAAGPGTMPTVRPPMAPSAAPTRPPIPAPQGPGMTPPGMPPKPPMGPMASPPAFKNGGKVKKTGMAKVHKGEVVLTKDQAKYLKKEMKEESCKKKCKGK